jgi:hypothetical protein
VKEKKTWPLALAFAFKTGLMTSRQRELKFPIVTIVRMFAIDGSFIDIRADDSSNNTHFIETLEDVNWQPAPFYSSCKVISTAFFEDSEKFKQLIIQQSQCARRNLKLCEDFFGLTVTSKMGKNQRIHTSKVVIQRAEKYPTVLE